MLRLGGAVALSWRGALRDRSRPVDTSEATQILSYVEGLANRSSHDADGGSSDTIRRNDRDRQAV